MFDKIIILFDYEWEGFKWNIKCGWIGLSYSLGESGRREVVLEQEKDPITLKELNEEPDDVKTSFIVLPTNYPTVLVR